MRRHSLAKHFRRFGAFYLMLVIPLTILIVFKYVPMYGLQIAFKNYRITSTIEKAPWVGLKHFRKFVTYLWEKQLGLLNTMWSFLLPATLNVHNMIVMRTYFATQIPTEIRESTEIDGCGEWRYLMQFVLPLSGSVLAVIALYYAVARWNSYFDAMIYLTDKAKLPLQNILREILIVNSVSNDVSDAAAEAAAQTRAELLKYAVIVVATLPMMLVYPFVQKFFVQGVMLGSVKG